MISICIPVYNFDVTELVDILLKQLKKTEIPYEIICIDDCSLETFKKSNEKVCNKEKYIQLNKNIGRAKIRNLFLRYAKYDNLLFLDCDSLIISDNFISKYIDFINKYKHYSVVCGGRIYDKSLPERNRMLRWKYGKTKESLPVNIRIISPNKSFMTNNFLIKRRILEQIKFDERIAEYGHEDTLFGFMLKKKGVNVEHIENPILNGDIETNSEYLKKTEKGINNLIHILDYVNYDEAFIHDVELIRFYKILSSNKITGLVNILFACFQPLIKVMLLNGYVSLPLFDFYKMGIFIRNYKRHSTSPTLHAAAGRECED